MKKTLSLVLATVLAFGMTATAFASNTGVTGDQPVFKTNILHETNKNGEVIITGADVALYSNMDAAYIEMEVDPAMKAADVKKIKVKGEWSVGKELVEKVSVVYKKIASTSNYSYFAEIKFKPGVKLSKDDLEGEVILYKSSSKNPTQGTGVNAALTGKAIVGVPEIGELSVKFVDDVSGETGRHTTNHTVWAKSASAPGGAGQPAASPANGHYAKVVSFDKDVMDEATITFDGVGEFDVNVKDQDKLFLGFDRKANMDIVAKYSYANMEFVNFTGAPMFNRTGIFHLQANDENTFVYAVDAEGAIAPVKSTWDAEYEAHKFSVRKFAPTYIISDVELEIDNTPVVDPIVPATPVAPETGKDNPNTGR